MPAQPVHPIYLDFEFSNFSRQSHCLSVGLCDAEGNPLFYGQLDSIDASLHCSDFVQDTVLPLFSQDPAYSYSLQDLRTSFFKALQDFNHPSCLVMDSPWDYWFVRALSHPDRSGCAFAHTSLNLSLWPSPLRQRPLIVQWDSLPHTQQALLPPLHHAFFQSHSPHHALHDAQSHAHFIRHLFPHEYRDATLLSHSFPFVDIEFPSLK